MYWVHTPWAATLKDREEAGNTWPAYRAWQGTWQGTGKRWGKIFVPFNTEPGAPPVLLGTRQGTTFELKKCLMLLIYFILRNVFYVSVKAQNLCFINLENYKCLSWVILSTDKAQIEFVLTILKNSQLYFWLFCWWFIVIELRLKEFLTVFVVLSYVEYFSVEL